MTRSLLTKISGLLIASLFSGLTTAEATQITINGEVLTYDATLPDVEGQPTDLTQCGFTNEQRAAVKKLVIIGEYLDNNSCVFNCNADQVYWGIETLDLSQAVLSMTYKFSPLPYLKEIIWPSQKDENGDLIPFFIADNAFTSDCMANSSLREVTIPTNCKVVGRDAFAATALEKVTVEGPSTLILERAFTNAKNIRDVYVLSGEEYCQDINWDGTPMFDWQGEPVMTCCCKKDAFDYDITMVQTDMQNLDNAAFLHIPEDAHREVFLYKDRDVLTQVLLNEHKDATENGWQEFIKNSLAIVTQTQIFRTFSDTKEHIFPQCSDIEDGVKAYYVVGTTEIDGVEKILIEPLNENGDYLLPANTGVLIYTKKGFIIYESEMESGLNQVSQYHAFTPSNNVNYLEATQDAPADGAYLSWSSVRRGQKCLNMFLGNKRMTDVAPIEWGFYTIYSQHYSKEELSYRAYLNMPTSIMKSDAMYGFWDGNGDVPPSVEEYSGAKVFDLDFDDELLDETTGLGFVTVRRNITSDNASVYNISGQNVTDSYNGICIRNGKKYISK